MNMLNKWGWYPVHQEGLSINEKILRHFDISSQYGVSFVPDVSCCSSVVY